MSLSNGQSSGKFIPVSPKNPCPVCRAVKWCSLAVNGQRCYCRHEATGAIKTRTDKNGAPYYVHLLNGAASNDAPLPVKPTGPDIQRADADTLHAVYSALLQTLHLNPEHRDNLRARGLTDEEIDRRVYRTLGKHGRSNRAAGLHKQFGDKLLSVPGFVIREKDGNHWLTLAGCIGLLIPVRDRAGRIVALKVRSDNPRDGGKYLWISSKKEGGPGPGSPVHVPLGTQAPAEVVRLTEGEVKADVAALLSGLPTVSAPGATNWQPTLQVLRELGCKTVRLAFDNDVRTNRTVAKAMLACAKALEAKGLTVEVERWPEDHKGIDDALAAGIVPQVLSADLVQTELAVIAAEAKVDETEAVGQSSGDRRPTIIVTVDEHEVNDQAVATLAHDPTIYQRAGLLVRIVRDTSPASKGIRRPIAPRIEALPLALLRERLAASAHWAQIKETKEGIVEVPTHPPGWCVSAVHARGEWPPALRHLEAVVEYPVLRPDGTVLDRPGFDPDTGLLLEPAGALPAMPSCPTQADAVAAVQELLDVVCDFPFAENVHRAAWVAALLTPLARFGFTGPAPLFLVDANVRAAGKGLLLDVLAKIVTGERFTIATYTSDEDELRKRITALALSGERMVLFDNLEGRFGNATLDAALTGTAWEDRLLGVNKTVKAPLFMSWYATGNNVIVGADTSRRVCHIRLESAEEHPERRHGFRHADLLHHVGEHQPQLLAAALTILRAYCVAGRPKMQLPAWGSYESWSQLVRSAVVWVGLPDPGETRLLLQDHADVAAESMAVLLMCWHQLDPDRRGLTAAEVIDICKRPPDATSSACHAELKAVLDLLLGRLDARGLGNRLRSYRRRIFQGLYIDHAGTEQRAVRWAVFPASAFRRGWKDTHQTHQTHPVPPPAGESGECSECVLAQTETPANSFVNGERDGNADDWGPYREGY